MIDIQTTFEPNEKRKRPFYIIDLAVGQVGIITDDDSEKPYYYYLRISTSTIIELNTMTIPTAAHLHHECVLCREGKITIAFNV